jgi:hypothetical protein
MQKYNMCNNQIECVVEEIQWKKSLMVKTI